MTELWIVIIVSCYDTTDWTHTHADKHTHTYTHRQWGKNTGYIFNHRSHFLFAVHFIIASSLLPQTAHSLSLVESCWIWSCGLKHKYYCKRSL